MQARNLHIGRTMIAPYSFGEFSCVKTPRRHETPKAAIVRHLRTGPTTLVATRLDVDSASRRQVLLNRAIVLLNELNELEKQL